MGMNKSEKQEKWAADRVQYIRGLKSPNEQQKLMLILTDKADKTAQDIKTLSLLMKAEQAAEKAQEARAKVMNLIQAEKRAEARAARKPVTMRCTSQPDCSSWQVWLTARRVSLLMIPLPCWVH
jgi:hypothetical protein